MSACLRAWASWCLVHSAGECISMLWMTSTEPAAQELLCSHAEQQSSGVANGVGIAVLPVCISVRRC